MSVDVALLLFDADHSSDCDWVGCFLPFEIYQILPVDQAIIW